MRRLFRQHHYALTVALRRLASQPFSSLSNFFVISLTLAIPILTASVLASVQPVVRHIPVSPEITLFLQQEANADVADTVADTLRERWGDHIAGVQVVARDDALEQLQSRPEWSEALSVLTENPLPDAIIVTLDDSPELARVAETLADEWRTLEHVDAVQLDHDWVRRLEAILSFLRVALWVLAVGVALVVLATVFNTVRMQALTQREEIAVARLVGATEPFVRRPFLYLGALTGLISGVLAIGFAALALVPLNKGLERLASTYGTQLALGLPDAGSLALSLVVVAILAAVSARWSVTRNTRF